MRAPKRIHVDGTGDDVVLQRDTRATLSALNERNREYVTVVPPAGQQILLTAAVAYPTSAGSASVTVFTVPSSPAGSDRFILEEFDVRTSAIGGADTGTVTHTVGLTAGGSQFMTAQNVTNATAAGIIGGLQLPTLGASHTAAQGYEARMDAGQAVVLQVTTAGGTVSAGKSATIYLKGRLLQ